MSSTAEQLWTLGRWGTKIENGVIVRVPWESLDHSDVRIRDMASTPLAQSIPSFPCDVCGFPVHVAVYDYQEIEPGEMVKVEKRNLLCDIHSRPSRVYLLDGSVHSLDEMRLEFPEGEPPVVKWENVT